MESINVTPTKSNDLCEEYMKVYNNFSLLRDDQSIQPCSLSSKPSMSKIKQLYLKKLKSSNMNSKNNSIKSSSSSNDVVGKGYTASSQKSVIDSSNHSMIPILKKNRIQEHIPTYEDPLLTESELDESSHLFSDDKDYINVKNEIKSEIPFISLNHGKYINYYNVDEEDNNDSIDDDNSESSDDDLNDIDKDKDKDKDEDEDEDEDEGDGIVLKGKFIKNQKILSGMTKEKEKVFNTIVLKSTNDDYEKGNDDIGKPGKYQNMFINEEKNSKNGQEEQEENKNSGDIRASSDWSILHDDEKENDIWSANIRERLKLIERPKKMDEMYNLHKSSHIFTFSKSNSSSLSTPVNNNQEVDESSVNIPKSSVTSIPSFKKLEQLKDNIEMKVIPENLSNVNDEKSKFYRSRSNSSSEIKNKKDAYVYSKSNIPIASKTNSSTDPSDDYSDFILSILDYFSSDNSILDINSDDENKYPKNVNNSNFLDTSKDINSHHLNYSSKPLSMETALRRTSLHNSRSTPNLKLNTTNPTSGIKYRSVNKSFGKSKLESMSKSTSDESVSKSELLKSKLNSIPNSIPRLNSISNSNSIAKLNSISNLKPKLSKSKLNFVSNSKLSEPDTMKLKSILKESKYHNKTELESIKKMAEVQDEVEPVSKESEVQDEVEPVSKESEVQVEIESVSKESEVQDRVEPVSMESEVQDKVEPVSMESEVQDKVEPVSMESEVQDKVEPVSMESEVQVETDSIIGESKIKDETDSILSESEVEDETEMKFNKKEEKEEKEKESKNFKPLSISINFVKSNTEDNDNRNKNSPLSESSEETPRPMEESESQVKTELEYNKNLTIEKEEKEKKPINSKKLFISTDFVKKDVEDNDDKSKISLTEDLSNEVTPQPVELSRNNSFDQYLSQSSDSSIFVNNTNDGFSKKGTLPFQSIRNVKERDNLSQNKNVLLLSDTDFPVSSSENESGSEDYYKNKIIQSSSEFNSHPQLSFNSLSSIVTKPKTFTNEMVKVSRPEDNSKKILPNIKKILNLKKEEMSSVTTSSYPLSASKPYNTNPIVEKGEKPNYNNKNLDQESSLSLRPLGNKLKENRSDEKKELTLVSKKRVDYERILNKLRLLSNKHIHKNQGILYISYLDDIHIFDEPDSKRNILYESHKHSSSNDHEKVLVAGTVFKLIEYLTSTIDYGFVYDFLLTYRFYLTPYQLGRILITRYCWALANDDTQEKKKVRLRLFVVLRKWISQFWDVDFKDNGELIELMLNFIKEINKLSYIQESVYDKKINDTLQQMILEKSKATLDLGSETTNPHSSSNDNFATNPARREPRNPNRLSLTNSNSVDLFTNDETVDEEITKRPSYLKDSQNDVDMVDNNNQKTNIPIADVGVSGNRIDYSSSKCYLYGGDGAASDNDSGSLSDSNVNNLGTSDLLEFSQSSINVAKPKKWKKFMTSKVFNFKRKTTTVISHTEESNNGINFEFEYGIQTDDEDGDRRLNRRHFRKSYNYSIEMYDEIEKREFNTINTINEEGDSFMSSTSFGSMTNRSHSHTRKNSLFQHLSSRYNSSKSFVLGIRSEDFAQQCCLIEQVLLRRVHWSELLNIENWSKSKNNGGVSILPNLSPQKDQSDSRGRSKNSQYEEKEEYRENEERREGKENQEKNEKNGENMERTEAPEIKENQEGEKIKEGKENEETNEENHTPEGNKSELGITCVIERSNDVSQWVASEILRTSSLDLRAKLIGKFIRIAQKCYRMNNFCTLNQIIYGLQNPYVERLKHTWSKVGSAEKSLYRKLVELTNPFSNFKYIREAMDKVTDDEVYFWNNTNNPFSYDEYYQYFVQSNNSNSKLTESSMNPNIMIVPPVHPGTQNNKHISSSTAHSSLNQPFSINSLNRQKSFTSSEKSSKTNSTAYSNSTSYLYSNNGNSNPVNEANFNNVSDDTIGENNENNLNNSYNIKRYSSRTTNSTLSSDTTNLSMNNHYSVNSLPTTPTINHFKNDLNSHSSVDGSSLTPSNNSNLNHQASESSLPIAAVLHKTYMLSTSKQRESQSVSSVSFSDLKGGKRSSNSSGISNNTNNTIVNPVGITNNYSTTIPPSGIIDKNSIGALPFTGIFLYDLVHLYELPTFLKGSNKRRKNRKGDKIKNSPLLVSKRSNGSLSAIPASTTGTAHHLTNKISVSSLASSISPSSFLENYYSNKSDSNVSSSSVPSRRTKMNSSNYKHGGKSSSRDIENPNDHSLINFQKFRLIAQLIRKFITFQSPNHMYSYNYIPSIFQKCQYLYILEEDVMRELCEEYESNRGESRDSSKSRSRSKSRGRIFRESSRKESERSKSRGRSITQNKPEEEVNTKVNSHSEGRLSSINKLKNSLAIIKKVSQPELRKKYTEGQSDQKKSDSSDFKKKDLEGSSNLKNKGSDHPSNLKKKDPTPLTTASSQPTKSSKKRSKSLSKFNLAYRHRLSVDTVNFPHSFLDDVKMEYEDQPISEYVDAYSNWSDASFIVDDEDDKPTERMKKEKENEVEKAKKIENDGDPMLSAKKISIENDPSVNYEDISFINSLNSVIYPIENGKEKRKENNNLLNKNNATSTTIMNSVPERTISINNWNKNPMDLKTKLTSKSSMPTIPYSSLKVKKSMNNLKSSTIGTTTSSINDSRDSGHKPIKNPLLKLRRSMPNLSSSNRPNDMKKVGHNKSQSGTTKSTKPIPAMNDAYNSYPIPDTSFSSMNSFNPISNDNPINYNLNNVNMNINVNTTNINTTNIDHDFKSSYTIYPNYSESNLLALLENSNLNTPTSDHFTQHSSLSDISLNLLDNQPKMNSSNSNLPEMSSAKNMNYQEMLEMYYKHYQQQQQQLLYSTQIISKLLELNKKQQQLQQNQFYSSTMNASNSNINFTPTSVPTSKFNTKNTLDNMPSNPTQPTPYSSYPYMN